MLLVWGFRGLCEWVGLVGIRGIVVENEERVEEGCMLFFVSLMRAMAIIPRVVFSFRVDQNWFVENRCRNI